MMRMPSFVPPLALALALSAAAPALAVTPHPGPGDPRIHVVEYEPSQVVELHGVLGFQLSLEFDPAERIENVAIGDSLGWQVTPNKRANLLFIKPMSLRPNTNMTVITNLRRYNFELSVARKPPKGAMPFTVRFLYPAPAVARIEPPPPPPPPVEANTAYSYEGSSKNLPLKVFDDGRDTYFSFGPLDEMPAIFAVDADGGEAVVNTRQRDGYVVIDRLARGFVLRRGKEVTRIFNDGFQLEEASSLKARKKEPWWRR